MRALNDLELVAATGGPVPVLFAVVAAGFGAGYVYGRDRAQRDNAQDQQNQRCIQSPQAS